ALAGIGGDELFAGYPSFRRALKFASAPKSSKRVLRAAAGVGRAVLNSSVRSRKFWELAGSNGSPEEIYRITRQLFAEEPWSQITGRRIGFAGAGAAIDDEDVVNAISRLELHGYMANTLLR